jgi:D-cysteine desulfhydrase family pyridoxal phosphate-dependent enzyme
MEHILGTEVPFMQPSWLASQGGIHASKIPPMRTILGRFPTPLQRVNIPTDTHVDDLEWWVKRDDLSSFDLSGNKVRKLEFLLWDAKQKNHDCVITVGGEQSNHARATAVAARQLGLDPYLILRRPTGSPESLGLAGNILFDRMVGSKIFTVSTGTYAEHGGDKLASILATRLEDEGRRPYVIPVGGSNPLGAFGYINCVDELIKQTEDLSMSFDHIVVACGSGGTLAGLAIGHRLAGLKSKLHVVGVCDSPAVFYDHLRHVATELGVSTELHGEVENWCTVYAGQGIGYAKSTPEELQYIISLSRKTGIILDPVYSGKALYHFVKVVMKQHSDVFLPGQKILFIHTGGVVGMYDKLNQLNELLPENYGSDEGFPDVKKLFE